jgi:thiamine biosynthesis lipoprotein
MSKVSCLFIVFLFACSSSNTILVTNYGEAQGSYYHIKYMSENGKNYKSQIDSILLEVDSSLSIYKSFSLISKLNSGESFKTDSLFNQVFNSAKKVYQETEGNFDCSVMPLVNAWGFYKNKWDEGIEIDSVKFKRILAHVGFDRIILIEDSLILPKGMSLDFNSIAQGFTVDVIASFLESKSIDNYLIEVGGEILAKGINADGKIWRVGVDKPLEEIDSEERYQFILDLDNKSLATSGNYRKFYEKDGVRYSHTISPFTGFPAQNRLLSVTVIHDNCMLADAYATSFMVMGVKKTKQFVSNNSEIEIYLIYTAKDGSWKTFISPNFKKRIIN